MHFHYCSAMSDQTAELLQSIDASVFSGARRNSAECFKTIANANPDAFILAYHRSKLVGYIAFFPIASGLGELIATGEPMHSNMLQASDILGAYSTDPKAGCTDVLLYSIAVVPDYQDKGIGNELITQMFSFLSEKIQNNFRLSKIHSYVSVDARALFARSGFTMVIDEAICASNDYRWMYFYCDDFSEAMLFLFVPLFFSVPVEERTLLPKALPSPVLYEKSREEDFLAFADEYMQSIAEVTVNEFRHTLSSNLQRTYLGHRRFVILDDNEGLILDDTRDVSIFLTHYSNFGVAVLVFRELNIDPSLILSQASMDMLRIRTGTAEEFKDIPFGDYIKASFKHEDAWKIEPAGAIRSYVSLTHKPTFNHMLFLLSGECYTQSAYRITALTGSGFKDQALTNHSQYAYAEMYVSERNIVDVFTEPSPVRLKDESTLVFIIELASLQLCAIKSIFDEIIEAFHNTEFTDIAIERVHSWYSNAAYLWDVDSFAFLGAKHEYQIISAQFGIPELKDEYKSNLDAFERLVSISAQKQSKRISEQTQYLIFLFTYLSGFASLSSFVPIIYEAINYYPPTAAEVLKYDLRIAAGLMIPFLIWLALVWRSKKKTI